MARKRMVDPEFWLDVEVATLPEIYQLFYIGTWNFSDDYGVIEYVPEKIRAQVFPYRADVDVVPMIEKFKDIKKYIPFEVDGKKYLYIKNFLKHQRVDKPSKFRNPPPPKEIVDEYSPNTQEPLIYEEKRSEEKRSKVKRREEKLSEYGQELKNDFDLFWKEYPRKEKKQDALDAFADLKMTPKLLEEILSGLGKWKTSEQWQKEDGQYIPHPTTFINNRRWEDEPKQAPRSSSTDLRTKK